MSAQASISKARSSKEDPDRYAVDLVQNVCQIAGPSSYVSDAKADLRSHGVLAAMANHNTPALYDFLVTLFSYQGISDQVANSYIVEHGQAEFHDIAKKLDENPACPKLKSYWHFVDCRYQKSSRSCANQKLLSRCPLPSHDLRNGRLNQTAYSLFLFLRDVAGGDFIGWIDQQLAHGRTEKLSISVLRERLLEPMRCIFGVSDKILAMTLATLLIAGSRRNSNWFKIGVSMIAIDSLVHNFLSRTGILQRFKADHAYGNRCYKTGFCALRLSSIKPFWLSMGRRVAARPASLWAQV